MLHVPGRRKGQPYASATSAVRLLADDYGIIVIVDGTPNSLPEELLTTKRQRTLNLELMKREDLESVPEFNDLIKFLSDHQLADGVWEVLGGSPVDYVRLMDVYRRNCNVEANEIVVEIKQEIISILRKAQYSITDSSANTMKIVEFFRVNGVLKISKASLASHKMIFDSPNQVLKNGGLFLMPSTPAIRLMIKENLSPEQHPEFVTEKLFAKKSA